MTFLGLIPLFLCILGLIILIWLRVKRYGILSQAPQNKTNWGISLVLQIIIFYSFLIIVWQGILGVLKESGLPIIPSDNVKVVIFVCFNVLCCLYAIFALRFIYKNKLKDFGLKKDNLKKDIKYGALGYLVIYPIFLSIAQITESVGTHFEIPKAENPIIQMIEIGPFYYVIFAAASAIIIAPIVEEIIFRGIAYPAIKRYTGRWGAIFITSCLFGLVHQGFYDFFPIFILGISLAYLYEKTQSLIGPIILHSTNNAFAIGILLLFKYLDLNGR